MSKFHIWPEEPRREDGLLIVSATIETPRSEKRTLWYSIPESFADCLPPNSDPFVVGAIYLMMNAGVAVRVHGKVSPSLLRNLIEYQAAWAMWLPDRLRSIEIRADIEEESKSTTPKDEAILSFSGGVDACFVAYRHLRENPCGLLHRPTKAIMVHGFDIPLDEPEVFAGALERSEIMTSSLGLELIPIATNFRSLVEDWSHSFGSALASCMMLFSGRFKAGLLAQGFTYDEICLLHEGSNALTDPMLSSDFFSIVPDGAAFTRAEKIWMMRNWNEFLENLRVCWAGPKKDRNCCACEKCIRNILTFRALGLGLPRSFDHDVDDWQIENTTLGRNSLPMIRYAELGELAAAHNAVGPWVKILERRLAPLAWAHESRFIRYLKHPCHYAGRAWRILRSKLSKGT